MVINAAIKMGTTFTTIFYMGAGVVLREPTVAAISSDSKKIRAVGYEALKMRGKNPDSISLVFPVKNGMVTQPKVAAQLLKAFIQKLYPPSFIFKPKIKVIMGIPAGLKENECEIYEDICFASDISSVRLVPNIMLSAVGIGMPVSAPTGGMVVAIGGGTTEIAAISLSGIISGCAVSIGGEMMDSAITDYTAGAYNLRIGLNTAGKTKESIGSLMSGDCRSREVSGIDIRYKNPSSAVITSADLREALTPYYLRIAEAIESSINVCPPEISGDILKNGVYLTGGGAKIFGLKELFESRINLKITVPPQPELAAAIGGGKLLTDKLLLNEIQG